MAILAQSRSLLVRQLAVFAAFTLVPAALYAGPLNSTSKSIGKRTSSGSSGSRGGGGSNSGGSEDHGSRTHTHGTYDSGHYGAQRRPLIGYTPSPYRLVLKPKVELFVGVQSVKDSDYASDVWVRLYQGPVGMSFSGSHYVQRLPSMKLGDDIRMDVWSFTIDGSLLRDATNTTQLWVNAGISGVQSTDFDHIWGPTIGLELSHRLSHNIGLRGAARQYWFEHDVNAREYRAEVTASVLSVGYRMLKFNLGAPLHGPVVGLRVRF